MITRRRGQLDMLIARWQVRYRATSTNTIPNDHLIEALHKAGRYEDAQSLIDAAAADPSVRHTVSASRFLFARRSCAA